MLKKGYIFIDLVPGVDPKKFLKLIKEIYINSEKDYCCIVIGKYNLIIEKYFIELKELDDFLTRIREDKELKSKIKKTITYIGISPDPVVHD
ncbi:MAG: hypothetical protein ACTSYF_14305 [Promethearchaeota archaeon]